MIPAFLERILGKSWLTTLIGFIGALGTVLYPIVANGTMPTKEQWGAAILMAVFGMASKSYNATGTPKDNTPQ